MDMATLASLIYNDIYMILAAVAAYTEFTE